MNMIKPKTSLRKYQKRISEAVKSENALVVLPTGSGKTLIACSLVGRSLSNRPSKKVLFLVPTVDLVRQQSSYLKSELVSVETVGYCSDENNHGLKKFVSDLKRFDVLVTTPEAFRRVINQASSPLNFNDFGLILVDECHHVVKKHPYERVMFLAHEYDHLQLVGLSANLTYKLSEAGQKRDIGRLCGYFKTENVLTASNEEMVQDGYHAKAAQFRDEIEFRVESTFPGMEPSKVPMRDGFFSAIAAGHGNMFIREVVEVLRLLEQQMEEIDGTFKSPTNAKGKFGKLKNWGLYCERKSKHKEYYEYLRHWYEAVRLLVISFPSPPNPTPVPTDEVAFQYLNYFARSLDCPFSWDEQHLWNAWAEYFKRNSSRFQRLSDFLQETTSQCIVFVEHRITTHVIDAFIQDLGKTSTIIYSTRAGGTFRMTAAKVKVAVDSFRSGSAQVLVTTSVAEEGMDIPACNRVIRFDPIQTAVSLVQSRGRARQKNSEFVVMENNRLRTIDELKKAEGVQQKIIEKKQFTMKKLVKQPKSLTENPVSRVHKYCQKNRETLIDKYQNTVGEFICTLKVGGFTAVGSSSKKKLAKREAAKEMLKKLNY